MGAQIPTTHEFDVLKVMAQTAAQSKIYARVGGVEGIMVVLLTARELGLPPMLSLAGGINMIQGKPELSARAMSAVIRRGGHSLRVKDSTDEICTLIGKRQDTGDEMEVSFTIEEAKRSGLVRQNSPWTKTPSDMLFARAMSRLARRLFSDCIGTCYVAGEISESLDSDKNDEIPKEEDQKLIEVDFPGEANRFIMEEEKNELLSHLDDERQQKLLEHFAITDIMDLTKGNYDAVMKKIQKEKKGDQ